MTSQQNADNVLSLWQLQRRLGIRPEDRRLPAPQDSFERDLARVREVMERG